MRCGVCGGQGTILLFTGHSTCPSCGGSGEESRPIAVTLSADGSATVADLTVTIPDLPDAIGAALDEARARFLAASPRTGGMVTLRVIIAADRVHAW